MKAYTIEAVAVALGMSTNDIQAVMSDKEIKKIPVSRIMELEESKPSGKYTDEAQEIRTKLEEIKKVMG